MDDESMKVVVNHEGQYSIWPATRDNPLGWNDVGFAGTKDECLAHIKTIWTDMTPISLRQKLAHKEPEPSTTNIVEATRRGQVAATDGGAAEAPLRIESDR
jgi:MbtH protein